MEIIYKEGNIFNFTTIESIINNIDKLKRIGRGTYCSCYKISDDYVIKYYNKKDNYDEKNNDYIIELQDEINFIKKNNSLPMIADTYYIIGFNKNVYIIQEFIRVQNIINITYNSFIKNIKFYIKLLDACFGLYKLNIVNIDIKYNNMGYDKLNNLKFFDFNLMINNKNDLVKYNLYYKYDYYYLHPTIPIYPKHAISYSIGIIILESFSTHSECEKFLYNPEYLNESKYQLLSIKKNLMTKSLFYIVLKCFNFQITPFELYENLVKLNNSELNNSETTNLY